MCFLGMIICHAHAFLKGLVPDRITLALSRSYHGALPRTKRFHGCTVLPRKRLSFSLPSVTRRAVVQTIISTKAPRAVQLWEYQGVLVHVQYRIHGAKCVLRARMGSTRTGGVSVLLMSPSVMGSFPCAGVTWVKLSPYPTHHISYVGQPTCRSCVLLVTRYNFPKNCDEFMSHAS